MKIEKTFFRSEIGRVFNDLLGGSRFERLLHKAFKEAKSRGVFVGCVQLFFPLADPRPGEAFAAIDLIPGWLELEVGKQFTENLAKSLGDWARFRDPLQTDICGDRGGPEKHVCGLEREHPGDHKQYHSSGGVIGWPRREVTM